MMLRVILAGMLAVLVSACVVFEREVQRKPSVESSGGDQTTAETAAAPEVETGDDEPEVEVTTVSGGGAAAMEPARETTEPAPESRVIASEASGEDALPAEEARYSIEGRVEWVARDGEPDPEAIGGAVVYFEPAGGSPTPLPGQYRVRTERKRFTPDVLVVPVGSTVAFPNDDDILHNVFSVSPNATFDLGRYGSGESRSHTFTKPGLALIHCDVHHAMQADILVVDTPYYALAADDGSFRLDGIPAGPGTLHIWHPRSEETVRTVTLPLEQPLSAQLEVLKPRVARHANKKGESYRHAQRTGSGQTEPAAVAAAADPAPVDGQGNGQRAGTDNVIQGRVRLSGDSGSPDDDAAGDVIVYYEPASGSPVPEPGRFEIGTRNKSFSPDVLVVPAGSEIAFPNNDSILHNVFSVSPNAVFDLGRYGRGESRSYRFDQPGLALIHCDVHHHMQADVLVVDTPYFARADDDGAFRLSGLPDGSGELHIWHPRAAMTVERVALPIETELVADLEITRPRVPRHLNKSGEEYGDARRSE